MRKKFYIDIGFVEGFIFMLSFSALCSIIYLVSHMNGNPDAAYYQIAIVALIVPLLMSLRAFNWVEIDSKGVYAKSLFGLIKFCTWDKVKYIEAAVTLERSKFTRPVYILFTNEDIKEEYKLTYNRRKLNIRIPYCDKTNALIKKYYNGEIIDLSRKL